MEKNGVIETLIIDGMNVVMVEFEEYDERGNKIHEKDSGRKEIWYEYDASGKLICEKYSDGMEIQHIYDDSGKPLCSMDSNGNKLRDYDENGRMIYRKNPDGTKVWYEYDERGNKIHEEDSNGYEKWTEYDEQGKKISARDSDDKEWEYEYDEAGRKTCIRTIQYVENDDVEIPIPYSLGEAWDDYNDLLFHEETSEWIWRYNKDGNLTYEETASGSKYIYRYEFWGNGIKKKRTTYKRVMFF